MQGSPDRAPARLDAINNIQQVYDLVRVIPALPMPTASPVRVTFDYRHVISAWAARPAVARAETALAREFGVRFTETEATAGDDSPRYLLEARLASGLVLVIVSRVQTHGERAPDGSDAGKLVAA